MTADTNTRYDEVYYPGTAYPQSHPERLATLARLMGRAVVPVDECRILELGCGHGENLIQVAYQYPRSHLVGIDYANTQVERGRTRIKQLGLTNIELVTADLHDVTTDQLGMFDYIVAHGLYSWVPSTVQQRVLDICGNCLSPDGVAYVSYNTLPGWNASITVRDAALFLSRGSTDPSQELACGHTMAHFLADHAVQADDNSKWARLMHSYRSTMQVIAEHFDQQIEGVLVHDELSPNNEPVYFREFMRRAAPYGLQFLSEANLFESMVSHLEPELRGILTEISHDLVEFEQYMDLFKNRMFRQSLLHVGPPMSDRKLQARAVTDLYIASGLRRRSPAAPGAEGGEGGEGGENGDDEKGDGVAFISLDDVVCTIRDPVLLCAVDLLSERFPEQWRLPELATATTERLREQHGIERPVQDVTDALLDTLLQVYATSVNFVEFRTTRLRCVRDPGERPVVSPVARIAAVESDARIVNLRHESLGLDPTTRAVLQMLDGTRDRPMLVAEFSQLLEQGSVDDVPKTVDDILRELARASLLEA